MARIVVTRPEGQGEPLVARLLALGHVVEHVPLVAIEALADDPIDVSPFDWVALTSANAARELRRRMIGTPARVAAIGRATADAFGGADIVAETATQEGLVAAMPNRPGRVLFACAEGARSVLPEALAADVVVLYRTLELVPPDPLVGDVVVVASPSAARALAAAQSGIPVVSMGPETTRVAVGLGLSVTAEAQTHDLDGLVAAVERATS